ncbi:MAG: hypothetical protein LBE76_06545 [Nitrososphaerota archaeon]|nr:hypothetical protein [Nitrososphaerota archaeon]
MGKICIYIEPSSRRCKVYDSYQEESHFLNVCLDDKTLSWTKCANFENANK